MRTELIVQEAALLRDNINKYDDYSMKCKQMAVTLAGFAIVGSKIGQSDALIVLTALPILFLWFLDAKFTQNNSLYTSIFYQFVEVEAVQNNKLDKKYDIKAVKKEVPSLIMCFCANTVWMVYLSLIVMMLCLAELWMPAVCLVCLSFIGMLVLVSVDLI